MEIDRKYVFFLMIFVIVGYIFRNEIVSLFADAYYENEKNYSISFDGTISCGGFERMQR